VIQARVIVRALSLAITMLMVVAAGAMAVDDMTPPSGGMSVSTARVREAVLDVTLTFADPESGIDHVDVHCDSLPDVSYPFATVLHVPYFDPSMGGCEGEGWHLITATAYNGAGMSATASVETYLGYAIDLVVSGSPTTGKPITFTPAFTGPSEILSTASCEWEVRWGNNAAILENDFNATFGSIYVAGKGSKGFCGPWTFTLPYAPVPHFQVSLKAETPEENIYGDKIGFRKDGSDIIRAAVGTTERRITASNLPVMMVLPDAYLATVGEPITYRLYPAGGADHDSNDGWIAAYQSGEHLFTQAGGRSFTFTPDRVGDWSVWWNAQGSEPYQLGAGYDPPAKRADTTRPSTTPPVTRIGSGTVGPNVPATVSWHGTDLGWGIDHYKLQRSVDGGAWGGTRLLTGTSSAFSLTPGHTYRFRVRAIDKAGNAGYWDMGPGIRVRALQETSSALAWKGDWTSLPDVESWAGSSRQTAGAAGSVSHAFTGRAIAWVAGRAASYGSAKVYLDGTLVATINLAVPSPEHRRIVWRRSWAGAASHRVKIVTTGIGPADVDGFVVLR
jgi:hypothetical protein